MLRAVKVTLEAWQWTTYMVFFCLVGFFFPNSCFVIRLSWYLEWIAEECERLWTGQLLWCMLQ